MTATTNTMDQQEKTAVFAGSFDPITLGHESVIRRALPLFDKIIVAIGINADKKGMFPLETRLEFIRELFKDDPKVEVDTYTNLTADYCKTKGARFLLRGLRTAADFEFERIVGHSNKLLEPHLETIFLLTDNAYSYINSSVVRDILKHGGDASGFLPSSVNRMIQHYMGLNR